MGKLIYYIVFLLFADLMFFIFINPTDYSLLSVIWTATSILLLGGSWSALTAVLSNTLFVITLSLSVIAAAGVGIVLRVTGGTYNVETFIWASIGTTFMINLGADFIVIFKILSEVKPPLTTILALIMLAPMIIVFIFGILEWIRGKD